MSKFNVLSGKAMVKPKYLKAGEIAEALKIMGSQGTVRCKINSIEQQYVICGTSNDTFFLELANPKNDFIMQPARMLEVIQTNTEDEGDYTPSFLEKSVWYKAVGIENLLGNDIVLSLEAVKSRSVYQS